ncbi:MAG: sensor histidine kinase [Gammaproteobacteria bacterium]
MLRTLAAKLQFGRFLSLRVWILLGFIIAVMPLFFAVIHAAIGLREISALGRTINSQVFEQTKAVQKVLAKTADTERKARLFLLLSDPSLRDPYELRSYERTRKALKQAFKALLTLHVNDKIALLVNELSEKEDLIHEQIMASVEQNSAQLSINEAFLGLRHATYGLSREFESRVNDQFGALQQQSDSLEQSLFNRGAILLLISLGIIVILLFTLARSMHQLDGSIRRLGSGELDDPIDVSGPSDMRFLGDRLEWLRSHLLDLEAAKQQFIQNVAREIESPLKDIEEYAGLFLGSDPEIEDTRAEIGQHLANHLNQLNKVALELRRYSRITAKRETDHKSTVNMQSLLESVIADFQPRLQNKSLGLKKLVRPVEISAIHDQLRIVIEQLLANAVTYSPVGGEIRIMLRDAGTQMELEFEDEGPGIDPEERTHVFEPFFRGKNARCEAQADQAPSPGLGLAIVKEYVVNHQGKVEVIEPRQDQPGARIRVQIPLTRRH